MGDISIQHGPTTEYMDYQTLSSIFEGSQQLAVIIGHACQVI